MMPNPKQIGQESHKLTPIALAAMKRGRTSKKALTHDVAGSQPVSDLIQAVWEEGFCIGAQVALTWSQGKGISPSENRALARKIAKMDLPA